MMMSDHWSEIYRTKSVDSVSWYQDTPALSLQLIEAAGLARTARIIDVGAGASTLADHLLAAGYPHLTLLDIAAEALQAVRKRIGECDTVTYVLGDITQAPLPAAAFDLWHDRAVFHFLTEDAQRSGYIEQVRHTLKPGGHIIVATFAPDGPLQCSGLSVARYDASTLHGTFGDGFELVNSAAETHITPWGSQQQFTYCYCRLHVS